MNILDIAIEREGGIAPLAETLGVVRSAVGNWRMRGLPRSWQIALALKYGEPQKPNIKHKRKSRKV